MCLSTVYRNAKAEENVCAKFVAQIDIDGSTITLTDVMGLVIVGGIVLYQRMSAKRLAA